uniref:Vitamin K-dependent protein S n=1 Tax=Oryzias sinensis TaxID=183150 RepID=A0A8C7YTM1_9TELE
MRLSRTLSRTALLTLMVVRWSHSILVSPQEANQFLNRQRRANQVFEETKQGHLERECVEEKCTKEEAREVFENDPETDYFYPKYLGEFPLCLKPQPFYLMQSDSLMTNIFDIYCSPSPCSATGTVRCEDKKGDFLCHCFTGWTGAACEEDVNECSTANGGCDHECNNTVGSYRCSCRQGYRLDGRHMCRDVDECQDNGVCGTARCENTEGGFNCSCDMGYVYDNESKSCVDVDECEASVCAGECLNTPGSFRCFCDGRLGLKLGQDLSSCKVRCCRNPRSLYLGRMFSGVPVVRLRFRRRVHTGFSAEFDFRTFDREGVIFFAGGHLNSSWIVVAMHRGRLELQLKYGAVSRVTSSGPVVNDGQWRKISVEEQGRSLVIKIDREAVMKIAVNGDLFTLKKGMHELNLTVGGVPFKEDRLVNQLNPRLDGCMKDWRWLTGEDTSIQETIQSNDNMQCFSTEVPGAFYPGAGFVLFNITYESQNLTVQLTLLPLSGIGVLFALVHQDKVPLSIALADYNPLTDEWRDFVLVSVGNVIVASSPALLCDGQRHDIQVTISGNQTSLLVDGEPGRNEDVEAFYSLKTSIILLLDFTYCRLFLEHNPNNKQCKVWRYSSVLFLSPPPDVPLVSTVVSAPYSGCMEVSVNGRSLDLDQAIHKHNDIRSHSCPLLGSDQ